MAMFDTKFGRLHVERSQKESALNLGFESAQGNGFASVPFGRQELLRAASWLGAAVMLRAFGHRERSLSRAQKDVRRRQRQADKSFGSRGGFGGGKRGRKRR